MPASKTTTSAEKRAQPARKRTTTAATKPRRPRRRQPSHAEISERAYFISLEDGDTDEFGNWLRAERELTAA
ncbi:MAG TPA: hypothetical protein VFN87_03470 [Solirubrobacteraceae bacterium]|nr:hypothetical protein [Solirubrobacteraceae bacterium]